jgi:hypothetical protein
VTQDSTPKTADINTEHEKLIEVLKFTPRTYRVRLWGYGGEYVMGTLDCKVYDYFKKRRLDVSEFAWNGDYAEENNIPEDMYPFEPGNWHDCDNMGHCWGVDRSAGTVQVDDENSNTIYEKALEDITGWEDAEGNPEPEWTCGDEIWIDSQEKGTPVFIGVSSEKGTFFEAELELKAPFDPAKLTLNYDEIDGNEIITSVSYDGEELNNDGGDTNGKSSDFGFYIAGSQKDGKWERYKDMDDIEYSLTEWFPAKVDPERTGKYNVETKDGYKYQALWNGEYWHNDWNDEKLKIKQWQGIAYDPDEQDLRDELDNIKLEIDMAWPNGPEATDVPEEQKELTAWTVSTYYKKSIEELEHFTKDGMKAVHRTGWRSGSWTVYTNDAKPPEFEFDYVPGGDGNKDSIDMNNCYVNNIEEVEMNETWDGCWDDTEWPDDIDGDEQSAVEDMMEDEGYYTAFEENGWSHDDTEMWIWGPIVIESDNGYRRIIVADENGNVTDFKEDE